jgi:uncharacterized protein (DUF2141 family)
VQEAGGAHRAIMAPRAAARQRGGAAGLAALSSGPTPERTVPPPLASALTLLAALAAEPAASGQRVTVDVTGFRNRDGRLQCSLFAGPDGFPDHPEAAAAVQRAPIAEGLTASLAFAGLVPGEYAVGCMHDENANGKFDQGLFGIPKEGYGFSNNNLHALRAPDWEESRFTVAPGKDVVLEVRLKY